MTDLKLEVSAGASRKLNRQQYGGAAYESSDVWVSFKKELPADADQGLVEATARHLQKMADRELEAEVKRVIQSVAPKTPPAQESHPRTQEGAKTRSGQISASQTPRGSGTGKCATPKCARAPYKDRDYCYQCAMAYKNGAVPAKPSPELPLTETGAPDF